MNQSKIGAFIATLRKEKGLTQAQLAEYMEVSNRAVSKWEHGQNLPDAGRLLQLCNYLGITVNELLLGERLEQTEYQEKAELQLIDYLRNMELTSKLVFGLVFFDMGLNVIFLISAFKFTLWFNTIPILIIFSICDVKFIIDRIHGKENVTVVNLVTVSIYLKIAVLVIIMILAITLGLNDLLNLL